MTSEATYEETEVVSELKPADEHVWAKGDKCRAKYEGDYCRGHIVSFKTKGTKQYARIRFRGFSSEDDEWVDVQTLLLHKPKATAKEKESSFDQDYLDRLYSQRTPQRKSNLTTDTSSIDGASRVVSAGLSSDSESESSPEKSSPGSKSAADLGEKPRFSQPSCMAAGEKVSLVLSEPGETPVVQVPALLNQHLRDYQREGIKFLYSHYKEERGCVLGDDMGLGKTVQVIGFISAVLGKTGTSLDAMRNKPEFIRKMSVNNEAYEKEKHIKEKSPFLIVGPACVVHNWLEELETWGHFQALRYHRDQKEQTLSELKHGRVEVVVTTLETCRDNIETLNQFTWECVIVDEAHRIKDRNAEVSKALNKIECLCRFGLTGTPLQNRLEELWCLMNWANPNCLGDHKSFARQYVRKIRQGLKQDATKRELAEARQAQNKLSEARNLWLLRRTKAIIRDQLPERDEMVVYCPQAELQEEVYQNILDHQDVQTLLLGDHPCECHSGQTRSRCCHTEFSDGRTYRAVTMTFMMLLMKAASHIAMLLPEMNETEKQKEMCTQLFDHVFSKHTQFVEQCRQASFRTFSNPKYCGKMKVLRELLRVFKKEKDKVLIFSQSTRMLDILENYVMGEGYVYRRMDGKTSDVKRQTAIKEFNGDPNVFLFLVSTKAGGVGLNLTGANVVVIYDPTWNPAHDLQAQDRAYRIGQRRDVRVFRLLTRSTIEENMYLRQIYKQQVGHAAVSGDNAVRYFHGIEGDQSNKGEIFGIQNIFKGITRNKAGRCLTEDILKRTKQIDDSLQDTGYAIKKYEARVVTQSEDDDMCKITDDVSISDDDTRIDDGSDTDNQSEVEHSSSDADEPVASTSRDRKITKPHKRPVITSDSEEEVEPKQKQARKSKSRVSFQTPPADPRHDVSGDVTETLDTVSDVLAHCGVVHTHRNLSITGGSKSEDHMSRRAIQDVYELNQNTQAPAADCEPLTESESEDEEMRAEMEEKLRLAKLRGRAVKPPPVLSVNVGKRKILIGQTPVAIRHKQFDNLVKVLGSRDKMQLARRVLYSSEDDRNKWLGELYNVKRFPPEDADTSPRAVTTTSATSPGGSRKRGRPPKDPLASTSGTVKNVKRNLSKIHRPTMIKRSPIKPHIKRVRAAGVVFEDASESDVQSLEMEMPSTKQESSMHIPGALAMQGINVHSPGGRTRQESSVHDELSDCESPPRVAMITLDIAAEKDDGSAIEKPWSTEDSKTANSGKQQTEGESQSSPSLDVLDILDQIYHSPAQTKPPPKVKTKFSRP